MESPELNKNRLLTYEQNKLHQDIDFDEYAQIEGANQSALRKIIRSPAHYWAAQTGQVKDHETKAKTFGKLFHYALLEGAMFRERYVVEPEFVGKTKDGRDSTRSAEARTKKEEWYANLPETSIVVPAEFSDQIVGMVDAMLAHPLCRNLLEKGVKESSMWWTDDATGELCKMRSDFISPDGIGVDIKTCEDARPSFFERQIRNVDKEFYALQAAHYTEGARITKQFRSDVFLLVAIEKAPPYGITVNTLGLEVLGWSTQWRDHLLRTYSECKKKNKWPCYSPAARDVFLPESVAMPPEKD